MERIDLVVHPLRMRVVLALGTRTLTTQQLAALLPDVPQSTLYRHINLLIDGGVLRVVRESKVRGAVERELALVEGAGRLDMAASAVLSPEQQELLFTTFLATLLADFRRSQTGPSGGMPSAIYTRQRLYLTREMLEEINREIEDLLAPYKQVSSHPADAEALPWLFTGIIVPDTEPPVGEENES